MTARTDPYQAPYFFPTPRSPEAADYVRRVRSDRNLSRTVAGGETTTSATEHGSALIDSGLAESPSSSRRTSYDTQASTSRPVSPERPLCPKVVLRRVVRYVQLLFLIYLLVGSCCSCMHMNLDVSYSTNTRRLSVPISDGDLSVSEDGHLLVPRSPSSTSRKEKRSWRSRFSSSRSTSTAAASAMGITPIKREATLSI